MEKVRRVLESYHIYPVDIEKVSEKLFKIKGNKHHYALKKSHLHEEKLSDWLEVYRIAQATNLQSILPVYLTNSNQLYVKEGNDIYYLTPWIDSTNRNHPIEKIYQHIGYIHAKTKKSQPITADIREKLKEDFLLYKKQMIDSRKKLLFHVEEFEQEHFMSPVELLVCTQYRDMVQVYYLLEKRINQYIESLEDVSETKVTLCHGRLKDSHFLSGNQYYFINWEQANYQHPIVDLTQFIKNKTLYYDSDKRLLLDKFKFYMEENRLEIHELTLLAIYLLDPSAYLEIINDYISRESDQTMIDTVIRLQRLHRQLVFGISFSEFVEEEYEMISLDESSSES
ncbi:hypothetical protein [Ornithinibacillus halotolerans]|uniref:Spore coat protein YsxE n=1 Tax=Ornithinibacillus halotolerans TaxID=1274357 RepID=A0A916S614_9BACI|nr:hypothetical protein [Ornithinibacillus halotolerans]GGA85980.1 hypothetical protein GCM10008025_31160 [Ornithinibacillus halotolerans]